MREKWLDTLKGFACIIVFLDHFYLAFCTRFDGIQALLKQKPFGILVNGNFAVCLFLMISAYVISVSVYTHKNFAHIQKMAFKRYFRLMLPVFFASILSLIISRMPGYFNRNAASVMDNQWLAQFFAHELTIPKLLQSVLIGVWWEGNNLFNGPFWMLYILFLGTFMVIILAMVTATENNWSLLVLSFMLVVYSSLENYLFCMVLGTFLAYLKCKTKLFEQWDERKICVGLSIAMFIGAFYLPAYQYEIRSYVRDMKVVPAFFKNRILYNGIGSFLLVFSIMGLDRVKRFLGSGRIMEKINEISFSVYLVHWLVIASFSCGLYLKFWDKFHSIKLFVLILFIVTTIVVLIASKIFYEVVEKRICNVITNKICNIYFDKA